MPSHISDNLTEHMHVSTASGHIGSPRREHCHIPKPNGGFYSETCYGKCKHPQSATWNTEGTTSNTSRTKAITWRATSSTEHNNIFSEWDNCNTPENAGESNVHRNTAFWIHNDWVRAAQDGKWQVVFSSFLHPHSWLQDVYQGVGLWVGMTRRYTCLSAWLSNARWLWRWLAVALSRCHHHPASQPVS